MTSPSESLTNRISSLLAEEKIFLEEDAKKYNPKIAAGTMKSEDWLLAIEKALDKERYE